MSNLSRRALVSSVAALPVFAIPAVASEPDGFDRAAILARAEQMVEFLSTRYVRAGWSFDQQRAARFLDAIRTLDLTSEDVSQKDAEINAEINSWVSDHGAVIRLAVLWQHWRDDLRDGRRARARTLKA